MNLNTSSLTKSNLSVRAAAVARGVMIGQQVGEHVGGIGVAGERLSPVEFKAALLGQPIFDAKVDAVDHALLDAGLLHQQGDHRALPERVNGPVRDGSVV